MIKKQAVKTILFLIILFFGLFLFVNFARAQEATPEGRALEIVYPQIPGVATPKVISTGLPEYIEYIFRFSIWIIGFVILGALIYAGFQYFTSFGNPEKLSAAKNGITSAFLGGIILLASVLIFNTINPQLVILELPDPKITEPKVRPGIYLCNYNVPEDINSLISEYMSEDKDIIIDAAKKLKNVMKNNNRACFYIESSRNLDFVFEPTQNTAFVIPRKDYIYVPATETEPAIIKTKREFDYGIIYHEKDNFRGKCQATIYDKGIASQSPLNKVKSVTFFKKTDPNEEPDPSKLGVILYQCLGYNEGGKDFCPIDATGVPLRCSFKPVNDLLLVAKGTVVEKTEGGEFGGGEGGKFGGGGAGGGFEEENEEENITCGTELGSLAENTRSIKIDPEGSYFAILFSEDNFKGITCEVISKKDNNLLDQDIGRCGNCSFWFWQKETAERQLNKCIPCLQSMIVVKGKVLY